MEALADFVLFLVASVLIARALERVKYRVAMVCHAITFTVLLGVFYFGSELPLLAASAKGWVGEEAYDFIHDVLTTYRTGIHLGVSAFFMLEIAVLVSALTVVTLALIKGYRYALKVARGHNTLGGVGEPLVPAGVKAMERLGGDQGVYLTLGHLRI
ncbi:MAG: hypothetical protein K6E59_03955 [Bacilli bacterium]|nr:hypothetical protein [Bacilli bacterium]